MGIIKPTGAIKKGCVNKRGQVKINGLGKIRAQVNKKGFVNQSGKNGVYNPAPVGGS